MIKIPRKLFYLIIFILTISNISNIIFLYQNMERNTVVRVVDGDSFETKDGRRIRLLGIDAPDRRRCLYNEAREGLKELVLGKRVSLTNIVTDDYGRILANVFVDKGLCRFLHPRGVHLATPGVSLCLFVNKIMIEEGLAKFVYVSSPYYEELKETAKMAKEKKIGIYSDLCRETTPKDECLIKGNINTEGEKLYHLPYCLYYQKVIIDRAFGDRWFCTEEEATAAGFRKAGGC